MDSIQAAANISAKLTLPADTARLPELAAFLERNLLALDCPMGIQNQIQLAAEEIFVNIANYAYVPNAGAAEALLAGGPGWMRLSFRDGGVPYDPLLRRDPDVTLPAEERRIGGLGIFLTKKLMDEVLYAYTDGKNVLTMTKRWPLSDDPNGCKNREKPVQ